MKSQRQLKHLKKRRQRGDFTSLKRPLRRSFISCDQNPTTAVEWYCEYAYWLEFEGRISEAVLACQHALYYDRKHAKAWLKLGLLYEKQFEFFHCLNAFSEYLRLAPEKVSSGLYLRVARAFENLNLESSALPLYLKALESEDVDPGVYFYLAQALDRLGDVDAAMECLMTLGRMFPAKLDFVAFLMGYSLEKKGFYAEALRCYQEAAERQPYYPFWQLKRDVLYPLVMQDAQEIEAYHLRVRDTLEHFLTRLAHQPIRLTRETVFLLSTLHNNAAYIAYHHLPVLPIRQQMTKVVEVLLPAPDPFALPASTLSSGKRIHLGVMFAPKSVSLGYVYAGALAEQLDPERFEVTLFCVSPDIRLLFKPESRYHIDPAHKHVHWKLLAQDVYTATRQVRESQVDAFFFTEPAWDFQQNAMALFRVAPVQFTSWMNPGSSGLNNMDYFYSCALMENAASHSNYSETLIAENEFPSFIPHFEFPEPVEREHFGLSTEWHLYGCLQNLLKMHPDFDPMIADLLRSDPLGHLILVSAKHQKIAESLSARFEKHMPDVMDRIWIFPELPNLDFLRLLQLLDVVLDPLYYGGGTTTYQALAWGAPLVTLPGSEMIGRITAALCKALAYEEAIVDSPAAYVQRAIQLAHDPKKRRHDRAHLRARKDVLFENVAAVLQFERVLETLCTPHRSSPL